MATAGLQETLVERSVAGVRPRALRSSSQRKGVGQLTRHDGRASRPEPRVREALRSPHAVVRDLLDFCSTCLPQDSHCQPVSWSPVVVAVFWFLELLERSFEVQRALQFRGVADSVHQVHSGHRDVSALISPSRCRKHSMKNETPWVLWRSAFVTRLFRFFNSCELFALIQSPKPMNPICQTPMCELCRKLRRSRHS